MRKNMLPISLLLIVALIAALLFLINSLGGWNHFLYKIQNRGLSGTYQHRTELLSQLPIGPDDIVFLGNSITEHCEWSELFQNPHIKNRGIAGDGVEGVLRRLPMILNAKPKAICLMIGINDLFYHDITFVLTHYERILKQCKTLSPRTQVVLQSLLPVNNSIKNIPIKNIDIVVLNASLQQLSEKYKYPYLDIHSNFIDDSGKLNKDFSVDGIHINGRGYILWRDLFLANHAELLI